MFELSIFGYNILMNYHQANRNFEALYTLYQNLTLIAKQLIDAVNKLTINEFFLYFFF